MNFLAVPTNNINAYIKSVNAIPCIAFEEEVKHFTEYKQTGSLDALKSLLLPNLKHPVYVAYDYNQAKFDIADLIQEGNVGLLQALKNFDPSKGFKFATLARHYVTSAVKLFVQKNNDIVGFTSCKKARTVLYNIRKFHDVNTPLSIEKRDVIAKELSVEPHIVANVAERLLYTTHSLNLPLLSDEHDTLMDMVEDHNSNFEEKIIENDNDTNILECLDSLNEREKYILESYYSDTKRKTQRELANELGISNERVRQLRMQAIERVKKRAEELELI